MTDTIITCVTFVVLAFFIGWAVGIITQFQIESKLEDNSYHRWTITDKTRNHFFTGKFDKDNNPIFDVLEKAKMYKTIEPAKEMLSIFNKDTEEPDYFLTSFWPHESATNVNALAHTRGQFPENEK